MATDPLYVPGLHHHRPGEESQSLSEEMVRPTAELKQHGLQTDTPLKIDRGRVQSLASERSAVGNQQTQKSPGQEWLSRLEGSGEQRWQWKKQSPAYTMESWWEL